MFRSTQAWIAAGALLLAAGVAQAGTINFLAGQTQGLGPWGEGTSVATNTIGQTFTASAALGLSLDSFELRILNVGPGAIDFKSYVYAINGDTVTGSALFQSGNRTAASTGLYVSYAESTGGVSLVDGNTYILVVSTIGFAGSDGGGRIGISNPLESYAGGTSMYHLSRTSFTASAFTSFPADLAFRMDFSNVGATAIPLPSAAWMGLAMLGGLGVAAHRRKRKSVTLD